jgi:hypothetical protein
VVTLQGAETCYMSPLTFVSCKNMLRRRLRAVINFNAIFALFVLKLSISKSVCFLILDLYHFPLRHGIWMCVFFIYHIGRIYSDAQK